MTRGTKNLEGTRRLWSSLQAVSVIQRLSCVVSDAGYVGL